MKISKGQYGQSLKNYLKQVKFDRPETEQKFDKAMDQDGNKVVDEKEAKEALRRLDMFNRPNLDVLTESEVDQIAKALKTNSSEGNVSSLEALGTVYDVPNTSFKAVILKKDAVEKATGKTLKEIFASCPTQKAYQIRGDGYIVDTDMYQDALLLKAINDANPKLKMGMFNHRAAEAVYKVLNRAGVHTKSDIWWFNTGSRLQKDVELEDQKFDEPALVFEDKLEMLEGNRFVDRDIVNGAAYEFDPDAHDFHSAVVFGVQK